GGWLGGGGGVGVVVGGGRGWGGGGGSPGWVRHSFTEVADLPIDTPSGGRVRLGSVANVSLQPNPNAIDRQGDSRYLDVGAAVSGRDLGAVVNDIDRKLAAVHLGRGYHIETLREVKERQAPQAPPVAAGAHARLLQSSLIAGIVILLLLQASFRRWRLALLAFVTLPMALVGGILAAWAGGGIISLGSLVGFFTVFGIAARNGILMINHWQH